MFKERMLELNFLIHIDGYKLKRCGFSIHAAIDGCGYPKHIVIVCTFINFTCTMCALAFSNKQLENNFILGRINKTFCACRSRDPS